MRAELVHRVRGLLRSRPAIQDGHDEQTAAQKLGYVRRADHPWLTPRPLNPSTPPGCGAGGGVRRTSEVNGDDDFTG
jgi:hypothetical protein